ncbi:MAG: Crp/Fnr family transcriptional regulator, partial [Gallionella sp.]
MQRKSLAGSFDTPQQNHLLAALSAQDYARLLPELEFVSMPLGLALCESGDQMHYLYFPTTSIVSLLYVMENGATGENAVIGNEGVVGIALFLGGESTPNRAVVQSAGNGYRIRAIALKREFAVGGQLQNLMLRFTQALIAQMAQTAVCNRHHTLD